MNEKLLILFLVLAIAPTPYELYFLYKSKFKTVGHFFMLDVSDALSSDVKINRWSFDSRYSVNGVWNGYPVKVVLGVGRLEILLISNELRKVSSFLFKYPSYKDGITHVGNELQKYIRSSELWSGSYKTANFLTDLDSLMQVHDEIRIKT